MNLFRCLVVLMCKSTSRIPIKFIMTATIQIITYRWLQKCTEQGTRWMSSNQPLSRFPKLYWSVSSWSSTY